MSCFMRNIPIRSVFHYIVFIAICFCGSELCFGQIDSIVKQLNAEEDEAAKLDKMVNIIELYKVIDTDSAMYFCDKATDLSMKLKNDRKYVEVLILKSDIYSVIGNFDEAMKYAISAKTHAEKINDKRLKAASILAISNVYTVMSFNDLGYETCMLALDVFCDENDLKGQRKCYTYLGSLALNRKQYDEAVTNFQKALELSEQLNDKFLWACSINNLGAVYASMGHFEKSKAFFISSEKISIDNNLKVLLIHNYTNLAILYCNRGEYAEALHYCDMAMRISEQEQHWKPSVILNNIKSITLFKKGDYLGSLKYAMVSDSINGNIRAIEYSASNAGLMSDAYMELGKTDSAFKYYKSYIVYKDSLESRKNETNLQKIKYEYGLKRDVEQQNWRNTRNVLIMSFVFLLMVCVIIFFILQNKKNKLMVRNIELENKNLGYQLDHKKREITTKLMYIQKKNEAISSIAERLKDSTPGFMVKNQAIINDVVKELSANTNDNNWKEFELRFEEVHPGFFKNLLKAYPTLTQNEQRLCAYLKLNMSTKDIAKILYLSVNSVISARYRLRKKLGLNNSEADITKFLDQF